MRALPKIDAGLLWFTWLSSITLLSACPGAGDKAPTAACTAAYEKCMLSSGVLGICDNVDCAPGQAPPCLVCRSQH
jgi:hypothetical protein